MDGRETQGSMQLDSQEEDLLVLQLMQLEQLKTSAGFGKRKPSQQSSSLHATEDLTPSSDDLICSLVLSETDCFLL